MAVGTTAAYEQMVLETSEDGIAWARPCGLTNFTATFTSQTSEDRIPDCDDESLPHVVERAVEAVDFNINGEGKWAQESHELLLQWMLAGEKKRARIGYLNAAMGDVQYVTGRAILGTLEHRRTKGISIEGNIALQFTGALVTTDAP